MIGVLTRLVDEDGPPEQIRNDNGPEFIARTVREWLAEQGTGTLFIAPGENLYMESFNGKLDDQLLGASCSRACRRPSCRPRATGGTTTTSDRTLIAGVQDPTSSWPRAVGRTLVRGWNERWGQVRSGSVLMRGCGRGVGITDEHAEQNTS